MYTDIFDFLEASVLGDDRSLAEGFRRVSSREFEGALDAYCEFRTSAESSVAEVDELSVYADFFGLDILSLATQCSLYLNQLHIADPLYQHARPVDEITRTLTAYRGLAGGPDRAGVASAVRALRSLQPGIAAGYVHPRAESHPPREFPFLDSDDNFYDLVPPPILRYSRPLARVNRVVVDSSGRALVMRDAQPSCHVNVSFTGHPRSGFGFTLETIENRDGDGLVLGPRSTPPDREHYNEWVDGCKNRASWMLSSAVVESMKKAAALKLRYFTDSTFVAGLLVLPAAEGDASISDTVLATLGRAKIPVLNGLSLAQVMKVRDGDGEAFQSFRAVLERTLRELRSVTGPEARRARAENMFHELAEVNVREVHRAARNAKKQLGLEAALTFAGLAATFGLAPWLAFAGAASLGVARLVGRLDQVESQLRAMPGFFLWKAGAAS